MILYTCLISFSLLIFGCIEAKTVSLKTGKECFINVNLDGFGYSYTVQTIDHDRMTLTLEDGFLWHVQPMSATVTNFYNGQTDSPQNILALWQPQDVLFFHRVLGKDLIVYNATRDLLLDVTPIKNPTAQQSVLVNTEKKKYYDQIKQLTCWDVLIIVSDGSIWNSTLFHSPVIGIWGLNDPIRVIPSKDRSMLTKIKDSYHRIIGAQKIPE